MLSIKTGNKTDPKMIVGHWYAVFPARQQLQPINELHLGQVNQSPTSAQVTALHVVKRSCHPNLIN